MPSKDTGNASPAAREARIKNLALYDWQRKPVGWIREELDDVHYQTLCEYRSTELYKVTLQELRDQWDEAMRKLPETAALKKRISHAMTLGLDAVIDILAGSRTSNRDKIAAARLAAQLDGRFLKEKESDLDPDVDSVAEELLTALKRHEGAVN